MARIAWGRNKTQLDLSTYPDNPSVPIGSSEWNQDPEDGGILGFTKQSATIASNTFAPTKSIIEISAGTVNTIGQTDTNEFDLLYLFASSGATVTLAHNNGGTGQVTLLAGVSKTISETSSGRKSVSSKFTTSNRLGHNAGSSSATSFCFSTDAALLMSTVL